jgi:polyhydroxyalkanoate synthesis regulator phasin
MVNRDAFQRYIDAGVAFTNITRSKAEELVQELVQSGEFQSDDARAKVEELIERSRKGREALVIQVRREVSRQLEGMGITNVEDLAKQVSSLLARTAEAGRAASAGMKKTAAKKATGKKAAAKKSSAKKATGKKAAAKAAVKRSPAKKAAAKKAPSAGTPGPRSAD